MVEYLKRLSNVHIVIVDNASTYPPLVDWLHEIDVEVNFLPKNLKYRGVWTHKLIPLGDEHRSRFGSPWYCVSDPDLDLTPCPLDMIDVLVEGLSRHPLATKSGLSLEINDIPDHYQFKKEVIEWESKWWRIRASSGYFRAPVDTTFALYHCDRIYHRRWVRNCIRSDRPYTARHMSWYLDLDCLSEEDEYYHRTNESKTHWSYSNAIRTYCEPVGLHASGRKLYL